jgi:hypothetical protein
VDVELMKSKIALAACLLLITVPVCAKYSGGTGEPNAPYLISTAADLNAVGDDPCDWDKHFQLTADVNIADYSYTTALIAPDISTNEYFQGTAFTGTFDGNDCNIIRLTIDTGGAENDYLGLFGYISFAGKVKNLAVEDVNITGGYNSCYLGGLVGYNYEGTISNCYAMGSIAGGYNSREIGGLAGYNWQGTISDCYAIGEVTGGDRSIDIGGLVGKSYGTIFNCYSTGQVTGRAGIGGLVGYNYGGISSCYSTGSVIIGNNSIALGGLAGSNHGTISNCYSANQITGGAYCRFLGGLVGSNSGTISNSFWDVSTGGLDNGFGVGLPTEQMQAESTFAGAGWDFITPVWFIDEEVDYPRLRWEMLKPIELLDMLADDVIELVEHGGIAKSLLAKIDSAIEKLEDGDEKNDKAAVNSLRAFINAVQAQRGKKISEENADYLIGCAGQVTDMLSSE